MAKPKQSDLVGVGVKLHTIEPEIVDSIRHVPGMKRRGPDDHGDGWLLFDFKRGLPRDLQDEAFRQIRLLVGSKGEARTF